MNLIIDVGNTLVKFAVFKADEIVYKEEFKHRSFVKHFKNVLNVYPDINNAILSTVGQFNEKYIQLVNKHLNCIELNANTKLPFNNKYETPKTLGVDRIALVSASVLHFPDQNVLIIDAGTCVTYDFITNDNNYIGGAISPGLSMRYRALNTFTAKLPLLNVQQPKSVVGKTTESSIHSGVVNGIVLEIDGVIDQYKEQFGDLTVILTGGDSKFLSNQLKNSIFANSNFLLQGLNYILQFNLK
ncbi:MAG: type III pantothenate kinase [Winogradskyella sp.]|nr:type III pantothenate kinase [Winogradskyella sp.]NNL83777.1 type III pantothenate kinase [Winogradskyella sp.]